MKTMRALSQVFSAVITSVTVLAASAALILWLFRLLGTEVYIVRSSSMEPALLAGDLAVVDRRRMDPGVGDIIAFSLEDTVVAHRVCGVSRDGFQTRGDANRAQDAGSVSRAQVIGTVIGRIAAAGYLLNEIQRIGPAVIGLFLLGLNLISFGLERWMDTGGKKAEGDRQKRKRREA
ncbi:MAG: signal peptidase I [Lachnospiraceae bacterium]|nr:signal peptidase I [Lachnospiraceae bacterium]